MTDATQATQEKLDWQAIEPETLTAPQKAALAKYQAANKQAGVDRKAFEKLYMEGLTAPAGKRIVFTYRYGPAWAVGEGKARKSGKVVISLADYLKSQAA